MERAEWGSCKWTGAAGVEVTETHSRNGPMGRANAASTKIAGVLYL